MGSSLVGYGMNTLARLIVNPIVVRVTWIGRPTPVLLSETRLFVGRGRSVMARTVIRRAGSAHLDVRIVPTVAEISVAIRTVKVSVQTFGQLGGWGFRDARGRVVDRPTTEAGRQDVGPLHRRVVGPDSLATELAYVGVGVERIHRLVDRRQKLVVVTVSHSSRYLQ
jgi:hypothetical protein